MAQMLYDRNNLKDSDSRIVRAMENAMADILENDAIDEYIDNNEFIGREQGKLFKEWTLPFMKYLRGRADKYVCEWMMDKLDSYPTSTETIS